MSIESTSMDSQSSYEVEKRKLQSVKMKHFANNCISPIVAGFAQIHPYDLELLFRRSLTQENIEYNLQQYDAFIESQSFVLDQISEFLNGLNMKDIERDYEFQTTCRKFLKRSLKALFVFDLPNLKDSHPKELLETMRECFFTKLKLAVSGLVEILKKMPRDISFETLSKLLPSIIDFLNDSHIQIFTNLLIDDSEMSSIFGAVLLDHYCDRANLRSLENRISVDASYSSLLENVFKNFGKISKVLKNFKSLEKTFPDQFVNISIRLALTARYPIRFFSLLKKVFLVLKFPDPFSDLTCLPFMMIAFNYWIESPVEEETWHMLLELILLFIRSLIPKSSGSSEKEITMQEGQLVIYLPLLIKTVNFSLNGSDDLIEKALELLIDLVEVMDLKFLNGIPGSLNEDLLLDIPVPLKKDLLLRIPDPLKKDLLLRIPDSLKRDLLLHIPGSLKKDLLHGLYDAMKAPKKEICYKAATILGKFHENNRDNFEDLQRLAFHEIGGPNLFTSFKDKKGSASIPFVPIIDSVLKIILDPKASLKEREMCDSIAENFLDSCIIQFSDSSVSEDDAAECGNPNFRCAVKNALIIKFVVTESSDIDVKKEFLKKVIRSISKLNENVFKKFNMKHLDLYPILIEACVDVKCCMTKDSSKVIHLNCFDTVIKFIKGIEKNWNCFSEQVMDKIVLLCHESSWESKLLGCKVIDLLLKEASAKYKYCCIPTFLKHLLYLISDLNGKISFGSIRDARELLHNNLLPCFGAPHDASINAERRVSFDKTISILTEEIISDNYLVRKEARKCFNSLSMILKKSLSEFIKPVYNEMPIASWIYLFEDFEFSKEANFAIPDKNKDKESWFSQLKEICESHLKCKANIKGYYLTPTGHNLKIQECCGALHALCFNFTDNEMSFDIFYLAAHSSVYEILDAGLRCLEFILKKPQLVSKKRLIDLLQFYEPFCNLKPLTKSQILRLKLFLEIFPSKSVAIVLKHLRGIKNSILNDAGNDIKKLMVKLEIGVHWIMVLTIETIHYVDQFVIEEVTYFVTDIEKYLSSKKIGLSSKIIGFREPLLKFYNTFLKESVLYFFKNMSKHLEICVKDFLNDVTITGCKKTNIINLISKLNHDSYKQIINFINKYNDSKLLELSSEIWAPLEFQTFSSERCELLTRFFIIIKLYECHPLVENLILKLIDFKSSFTFLKFPSFEISKSFLLSIANVISLEENKEFFLDEVLYCLNNCLSEKELKRNITEVLEFLIIPLLEIKDLQKTCCSGKKTVSDIYFECVKKLTLRTDNIKILFLKFSSAIAQTAFYMTDIDSIGAPCSRIFERKGNAFCLRDSSLQEKEPFYVTYLLLSSLCPEIFSVLLEYFRKYYAVVEDFKVLVIDLLIAENHKDLLYEYIQNYKWNIASEDIPNLMNIIWTHRMVLYPALHAFANLMVNFVIQLVQKSTSFCDKIMSIDFIKILILGGYFYEIKDLETEMKKHAELVIHFLFKTACCINCSSCKLEFQFLSQKCLSLLKNEHFTNELKLFDLKFEIWDEEILTNILDDPEKCECFAEALDWIANVFDHMSYQTRISFVEFLEKHIACLFKSERILHSLFKLLSKFLQRGYSKKMYADISQFNDKYIYVKVMFEAFGHVVDNRRLTLEEIKNCAMKCNFDIVMKSALTILKNLLKNQNGKFTEVIIFVLYEILPPLMKKISIETIETVIEILVLCSKYVFEIQNFIVKTTLLISNEPGECRKKNIQTNYALNFILAAQTMSLLSTIYEQMLDKEMSHGQIAEYKIVMKGIQFFKNWNIQDGLFSNHYGICDMIFNHLAEKCSHSLFDGLLQICGNDSCFGITLPQFINLLSVLVIGVSFSETSKKKENASLFSSVVDLCHTDSFLCAHVWNHMFTGIWKILNFKEQKDLFMNIKLFLENIAAEKNLNPSPVEVFLNIAISCVPQLCKHFDKKYLFRSFATQVHLAMSLENYIFSEEKNSFNSIKILKEIYCNLEEPDKIYSLYQIMEVIKNDYIDEAVSHQLNGNSYKAAVLYRQAINEKSVTENLDANDFVKTQIKRCVNELLTWSGSWVESNEQINFEKELSSTFSKFSMMKDAVLEIQNDTDILLQCIESWKCFPGRILTNNHYHLLQLLQWSSELHKVSNLRNKTFESHAENLKRYHSMWKSGKYLLSDHQEFLAELFDVRCSAYENCILQNHLHDQNFINEITKLRYEASIEFSSTAINIGKYLIPLSNGKYTMLNDYDSIKDYFAWLLLHVKKSDHSIIREHQPQDVLFTAAFDIIGKKSYWNQKLNENEILSLNGYIEEIRNELIYKSIPYLDKTDAWVQLIKCIEDSCLRRDGHEGNYTMLYLKCLLQTCKFGNKSLYIKFITKLLWSLQNAHEMPSTINFLAKSHHDIPLHYWLPFLSLLILYAFQHKVVTEQNKHLITNATSLLSCVLIQLTEMYPQETFFAIWNFKSSFVSETQDFQEKEMMVTKSDRVLNIMESKHPRLISSLKGMMKDLHSLKSNIHDNNYHWFMLIMEKAYHSLFLILKSEEFYSEAQIVEKCKTFLTECQSPKQSPEVPHFFKELKKKNTVAEIFNLLTSTIQDCFQGLKKKSVLLTNKCKFLSSYHTLCRSIKILPKCHTLGNSFSPLVKIAKFEPVINVYQWINSFAYKMDVRGDDGKTYSYLLMENDCPKGTLKCDQLMQFLEIVNVFLAESGSCSQNFLKFHLPIIFSVSPSLKLVPFFDSPIPYLDIFKKDTRFLPNFDSRLIQDYCEDIKNVPLIKSIIEELFESKKLVPQTAFTLWVNNVYSPADQFCFKKQFLRDFSMQFSAEILNISSCKETMIHRKTGKMSPLYLEFKNKNLIENIPADKCVSILTPNLKNFFGQRELEEISNYVYQVSSVLQEDQRYLIPLLLVFFSNYGSEVYTEEEVKICEIQMTAFIKKRIGMSRLDIRRCLSSSTKLCHLVSLYP